jgi:hypothetical protein
MSGGNEPMSTQESDGAAPERAAFEAFAQNCPMGRYSIAEFSARVHYESAGMRHKCWCDVAPKASRHAWAVTEALKVRKSVPP